MFGGDEGASFFTESISSMGKGESPKVSQPAGGGLFEASKGSVEEDDDDIFTTPSSAK